MSTAAEQIAAWAELANNATDGPWSASYGPKEIPRIWSEAPEFAGNYEFIAKCSMKEGVPDAIFMAASRTAVPVMAAALTAVLALHSPTTMENDELRCTGCVDPLDDGRVLWPCPTVEAITAALGVTA